MCGNFLVPKHDKAMGVARLCSGWARPAKERWDRSQWRDTGQTLEPWDQEPRGTLVEALVSPHSDMGKPSHDGHGLGMQGFLNVFLNFMKFHGMLMVT